MRFFAVWLFFCVVAEEQNEYKRHFGLFCSLEQRTVYFWRRHHCVRHKQSMACGSEAVGKMAQRLACVPKPVMDFKELVRACGSIMNLDVLRQKPVVYSECYNNVLMAALGGIEADAYENPQMCLEDNGDTFTVFLRRKDGMPVENLRSYFKEHTDEIRQAAKQKGARKVEAKATRLLTRHEECLHKTNKTEKSGLKRGKSKKKYYDINRVLRYFGAVSRSLLRHKEALVEFPRYTKSQTVAIVETCMLIRRAARMIMSHTRDFRVRVDMRRQRVFMQADIGTLGAPFPEYIFSDAPKPIYVKPTNQTHVPARPSNGAS